MTTSTIIRDIRCAVEASRGDPGFFPTSEMVLRLAAELESVTAERDRLQRACDEGLRRVHVALSAFGVADCDDPIDALEAVAEEVPRRESEATDERNAAVLRARAEGRAAGLREAQEACRGVVGRLLDLAMEGGGPINCREAFGEEDPLDADGGECELIAAGASLCGEAVEALLAKGGGA